MNTQQPQVLILILNHNQKTDTLRCLESLMELNYSNYKILLVDNNSKDGTADKIGKLYPEVILIETKINLGCAGGRNVGIKYFLFQTKADYILFLDNDTEVDADLLNNLINVAESDNKIGLVAMKVYYFDEPNKFWFAGGAKINWLKGRFYNSGQGEMDYGQFDNGKEIDSIPGGFTFIKREVLEKAGKLDERYFIYYEDPDWCVRVKKTGFKIAFAPGAKVWHKASSSLGMESPAFYYYRTRNRLLFMWKNAPRIKFFLFFFYFLYDFSCHTLLTLYLSRKPKQFRASLIGVMDFLRGRFGERAFTEDLLKRPLCRTLTLKLGEESTRTFIISVRKIKFFIKRFLKMKLKILAEMDWNLGDEIMAIPMYKAIKDKFPNSIVNVKVRFAELLWNNPSVDTININMKGYDKIFNLRGENKTKNRLDYLSEKLRIKIKDRIPRLYIQKDEMDKINIIPERSKDKLRVAISTGAKWKSRQWGVEKFRELAEYLMNKYDAEIIELGKDCRTIGLGINLINKTSVREAAIILKRCKLFIGNDSGLVHLALAVGTPAIGLFGPLNPLKLIENKEIFYPLRSEAECCGCWSEGRMRYPDVCPFGISICMGTIYMDEAIKAVEIALRK